MKQNEAKKVHNGKKVPKRSTSLWNRIGMMVLVKKGPLRQNGVKGAEKVHYYLTVAECMI